jgi:mycothiol synthase
MALLHRFPLSSAPPGIAWRALNTDDTAALETLGRSCQATDGGFLFLPIASYLADAAPAIGAFGTNGELLAYTAVRLTEAPGEALAAIIGQVHPTARGRGIGRCLMDWSVAQGQALVAGTNASQGALRISTEGLTPAAARLYARFGFVQQFAEDIMRHDLAVLPHAPLPAGIELLPWAAERAGAFFAAYTDSFRTRPGFSGWSAEQWISWAIDDDDFRPDWTLLAVHDGTPVGFILGGEGWVVQVGVVPEWRGRGLGTALVAEVLRRAQAGGAQAIMLDVNVNNPGAARVYARLGFAAAGQRARYLRAL